MVEIFKWVKGLALGFALGAFAAPAQAQVSGVLNSISGKIVDSLSGTPGDPIGGARVWLELQSTGEHLPYGCMGGVDFSVPADTPYVFVTPASGLYDLILDRQDGHAICPDTNRLNLYIRVEAPGYDAPSFEDTRWTNDKAAGAIAGYDILLPPTIRPATVSGEVVATGGGSPDGSSVTIRGTDGRDLDAACFAAGSARSPHSIDASGDYGFSLLLNAHASCRSGRDFVFAVLPPPGYTDDQTAQTLNPGANRPADLVISPPVVVPPGEISGVVSVTGGGSAPTGSTVTIRGPGDVALPAACFAAGTTGPTQSLAADGGYGFTLVFGDAACPAGRDYLVFVTPPPGYSSDQATRPLSPGSDATANLTISPPAEISGVVSVVGGSPAGLVVTIQGPGGATLPAACFATGTTGPNQTLAADGRYGFTLVLGGAAACPVGGDYRVFVTPPPGYSSDQATRPLSHGSDATANLAISPAAPVDPEMTFYGVVYGDGGAPLPGAVVTLHGPSGALADACFATGQARETVGADGAYSMRIRFDADPSCPPSGVYSVHAEPPAGYTGDFQYQANLDVTGIGRDQEFDFNFATLNLQITKIAQRLEATQGEAVPYVLEVFNRGAVDETLLIEDVPSPWLTYVEGSFAAAIPTPFAARDGKLTIGPVVVPANRSLRLGYALRVSTAAPAGSLGNRAILQRRDSAGRFLPVRSTSAPILVSDRATPFEDSTVIGKVFYDCNLNGWQDQPFASGLTLAGGFSPGAILPGGLTIDRGFGPQPVVGDLAHGLQLGDLEPIRVGAGGQAGKIVIRARLSRPEAGPLRLTTAEGFDATLSPSGEWVRGAMAANFAGCADLRLMRAITPAPDGSHLMTIVIMNGCRAESGVAGARLATVEGLVIETDAHGRYHIADGRFTDRLRGSNMLIKLDEASLPIGARVISSNPQRLRLTGGPMQAANFAVSCPAPQAFYAEQTAEIGAVCFLPGTASIDPAQAGAITAAAEHLLLQGGGEVVVECLPCEGKVDEALNAGRVAAVRNALAGMLPAEIMSRVVVRSDVKGISSPASGGFSPIPAGGHPALHGLPLPLPAEGPTLRHLPLPTPQPAPAPSKGLFDMIFGSNESGASRAAGPLRVFALAGALLGAEEAKADAPGAGKPVAAPLVRGVIETPRPQFAPPPPFCPTIGRQLRPGEICPPPAPPPQTQIQSFSPAPVVTGIYCPDTGLSLPLGATCPKPEALSTAVSAPPVVEPPKPAFSVRPREICPEAACADLSVRSRVELPFGANLTATADAQSAAPRLDAIAPSAALLGPHGLAAPVAFQSFSNYPNFIQRWEIAIYRESDRNLARPLAVLPGARLGDPILWDGAIAQGQPLKAGENLRYVVRAYDSEGRRDETKPRDLLLTADAGHPTLKRPPRSAYGRDSLARQSIPIMGGRVTVRGGGVPPGWLVAVAGEEVPVNDKGEFAWEGLRAPGAQEIPVELAAPDGVIWNRDVAAIVPANSFFMVGLADLTVGQDYVSRSLENAVGTEGFQEDVFANGRLAFYLKGKIQGRYLITAQADTHENEIEHMFDGFVDYRNPQSMFRRLDPDRYYPVYGDGSVARSDVDTQGKFYVRIEDGDSSLLWGNANTGFTGTELARYERSLYGARAEYVSRSATSYGESRVEAKAFASQPHTAAAHNQFIGTGGSLYYLRQRDIVTGSEKLRVEIRERDSGRVIESVALIPGKDYEINAIQGRVILTNPLRSFAGRSGTNVVSTSGVGDDVAFLVADYEYVPDVQDGDEWTYGGRAMAWLGDHLRVGGTYVEENQESGGAYELMGADAVLRWKPGTWIRGEWARSRADESAEVLLSEDGGLNFHNLAPRGRGREGDAFSVEARADLAEIFASGWGGEVQGWWRERDENYSNVQTTLENFRRSFGGSVELSPSEDLRLIVRANETEYHDGDVERVAAAQIDKDFGRFALSLESRYEQEIIRGAPDPEGLIVGGRLAYSPIDGAQVYVRGQTSFMEEGGFVDATGAAAGFSAKLSDSLTAHAEYAWFKERERGDSATVGLDYQRDADHVVYGAYTHSTDREDERRHAFTMGQRATVASGLEVYHENLYGVRRDGGYEASQIYGAQITPLDDLSLGLSYQRSDLEISGDEAERDAISASARWRASRLELSGKAEYRRDRSPATAADQWLGTVRARYEVSPSTTLLGKAAVSHTDDRDDRAEDARFWEASVGLAYRPVDDDRLNLLAKYAYLYDLPALSQTPGDVDQRAHLVMAEGSYRVTPRLTFGAKGAYKHGEIREDRNAGGWSATRVSYGAINTRLRLFDNWDVLAEYRALYDLESEQTRHGSLLAVYRSFGDHFELGAGYNFAAFGDDLFNVDKNAHGWFINAVGKF